MRDKAALEARAGGSLRPAWQLIATAILVRFNTLSHGLEVRATLLGIPIAPPMQGRPLPFFTPEPTQA